MMTPDNIDELKKILGQYLQNLDGSLHGRLRQFVEHIELKSKGLIVEKPEEPPAPDEPDTDQTQSA